MSRIRSYERHEPAEPKHTCPDIDDVIATMEKLRRSNEGLRERGDYWKGVAEELLSELDEARREIDDLQDQVQSLQDSNRELSEQ